MRLLVLIVSLVLAAGAMAEEKPKPKSTVKQLDKATPILANTANTGDEVEAADAKEKANKTKTRAQDYNSSRSNTTSLRGGPESDTSNFGMSRSSERNKGQQGGRASGRRDAASGMASGKRQHAAVGDGLGKENRCSMGALDCDDDGDSVPTRERCGNGIDNDCDSIDEKAAPANHNTTRSNRTQPVVDGDDPVLRKRPGK